MPKTTAAKNRQKRRLSTEVIVAIIAGIFALGGVLVTAGPSWISALRDSNNPFNAKSTPTWPPLPIMVGTSLPTETPSPLRLSNFYVAGDDTFFSATMTPAEASDLPEDQKITSTTNGITFYFTVTSITSKEWVKFDNQFLFRVDAITTLPQDDRQNILRTRMGQGGGADYSDISILIKGPVRDNDILISPPTKDADYFTLQPGEKVAFKIASSWLIPVGRYFISIGINYEYMGNDRTIWTNNNVEIISPAYPLIWAYGLNGWESISP